METYRITLDGTAHTIPWHVVKAADTASFDHDEGVVVFLHPEHDAWMHVLKIAATQPEHETATKFFIRDGKKFDAAGKRLSGARS